MYKAPSSDCSLTLNLSFKVILRQFQVVFWCLEWECCTFQKINENSFKFTNTILWLTWILSRVIPRLWNYKSEILGTYLITLWLYPYDLSQFEYFFIRCRGTQAITWNTKSVRVLSWFRDQRGICESVTELPEHWAEISNHTSVGNSSSEFYNSDNYLLDDVSYSMASSISPLILIGYLSNIFCYLCK